MADVKRGIYVTELIGMGVNPVTGDYSRGASGFLIENGATGPAVAEITIAGNLLDLFAELTAADDMEFLQGRAEERGVGQEGVSRGGSGGEPENDKKKKNK